MRLSMIFVLFGLLIAACSPTASGANSAEALPPGDAVRGADLFIQPINGAPPCATCHTLDGTVRVGPSLQNFAANAPAHAGDASLEDYTHTSIVQPAAYIVEGFSNIMYAQYGRQLTPQQIADLVAYLLTL
jgi:mono/diheme cytochrome c family protein